MIQMSAWVAEKAIEGIDSLLNRKKRNRLSEVNKANNDLKNLEQTINR